MKVFEHVFFFIIGRQSEFLEYLLLFLSQNMNEEMSKTSEKPPLCPSATLSASATMEENGFGSKKARSSFGKGFFKIRGGKKTTSSPNLGECVLHDKAAYTILLVCHQATVPAQLLTCDFFLEFGPGAFFTCLSHTHRIYCMAQVCNLQPTHTPDSFYHVVPCCGAVCLFVCCF